MPMSLLGRSRLSRQYLHNSTVVKLDHIAGRTPGALDSFTRSVNIFVLEAICFRPTMKAF